MIELNIVPGVKVNIIPGVQELITLGLGIKLLYLKADQKEELNNLIDAYKNYKNFTVLPPEIKKALIIASRVIQESNANSQ